MYLCSQCWAPWMLFSSWKILNNVRHFRGRNEVYSVHQRRALLDSHKTSGSAYFEFHGQCYSTKDYIFVILVLFRLFSVNRVLVNVKVNWSRYRPGVAQRVGRGIDLPFHDRGTRSGWVVSSTPRPHFTPGKDPVHILQGPGWAPGPVWMGGKPRPHRDSIPDCSVRSQSLYRLSYPAHNRG